MRTKLFSLLVVLCAASNLFAYDFAFGGLYYNITSSSNRTVEVTYQQPWSGTNYEGLTSVTIPTTVINNGTTYSVTSIGYRTFQSCFGLTSITIPNSVTSIGNEAFSSCRGLTSITIPNTVTSIGDGAFRWCTGLTAITIPESVTSIGYYAFGGCKGLTYITIPNSVTSIGNEAFLSCTGLTSITIPNSVTSIGERVFNGCTSLTSIVVESGNVEYDSRENCNAIIETATNTLTHGCKATIIPNSVTSIGNNAFSGCSGLAAITIPESVTSIGDGAFSGCDNLTSITIPKSITSIGGWVFDGCKDLTSVVWNAKNCDYSSGWYDSSEYSPFSTAVDNITLFTFGNEVDSIPYYLCYGMSKLTTITIPKSVTSIGYYVFYGCTGLTSIVVESGNTVYDSRENCNAIIETATNTLIQGCQTTIIPNSVTSIGERAFSGCTDLTTVAIPNSVTSIGNEAFSSCGGLTSITIPNSVTSIGSGAFYSCTSLTSVTIPESVTSIGSSAFQNCKDLTSITIPNSVTSIGNSTFLRCTGLTSITIPNSVTSIGGGAFYECTGLTSIQVEAQTPPQCGDNSFYNIPQGISVYVPCGTKEAYHATDGWSSFTNTIEKEHDYIVVVRSSNEDYGTAAIVSYTCNELTIQATANEHYHFTQWSDDNTDNLRTFIVVQDTGLTAVFAPNQYSISVYAEYGRVQGAGKYDYGTTVTLTAIANEHYHFVQWSDGNTHNPRTFVVSQDTTLQAEFALNHYSVTTICEISQGIVTGGGTYQYGEQITLHAIPNSGYEFKQWSNGLTYNPYRFTVLEDLTIEAVFISSSATALEDAPVDTTIPQKVFRNGQVYILRGGKTYTLMGVEVE